jgi:hypothetical protein
MVLISIAFAARKIASAFEHPAIGRSQPREIDFVFLDLARKRAAGEVGETFFAPHDCSPDFHIKTIGNFQSHRFHGNTLCITLTLNYQYKTHDPSFGQIVVLGNGVQASLGSARRGELAVASRHRGLLAAAFSVSKSLVRCIHAKACCGETPLPTRRGGRYPGAAKMNRLALDKFVAAEFTAKRPSRIATHRLRFEIQILPKPNQGC